MFWHADWYCTEAHLSRLLLISPKGSKVTFWFTQLTAGIAESVASVDFHMVNLANFIREGIIEGTNWRSGRIGLSAEDWEIVIDNLRETRDLLEQLDETGGFAITHVGNLRRSDGNPFPVEDARKSLEGLYWFLSFARGRRTGPILLSGNGPSAERWQEWRLPALDGGAGERSWPPRQKEGKALASAWPGFLRLWLKDEWQAALTVVLSWYIEAAKGDLIESALVTGQAALELLSWVEHVEQRNLFSAHGFNRLPAEDCLQLLLGLNKISLEMPDALPDLKARAKASNWPDGVRALVQMRNGFVHPNLRKKRVPGVNMKVRAQAWQLMMHYLQLVLLKLFEYTGEYFDHLKNTEATVPWASS